MSYGKNVWNDELMLTELKTKTVTKWKEQKEELKNETNRIECRSPNKNPKKPWKEEQKQKRKKQLIVVVGETAAVGRGSFYVEIMDERLS